MKPHLSVSLLFLVFLSAGCEPELGSTCADSPDYVTSKLEGGEDFTHMVRDQGFEHCSLQLCMTVDNSRGFCTQPCVADSDCQGFFGEEWKCDRVLRFGQMACYDWSPETDCFDENGNPSPNPILYCTTTRETIETRDQTYLRGGG